MKVNEREKVVYQSPQNADERVDLAGMCVRNLGIEMPALVDGFENSTDAAYSGWPDRLYVIGRDGRVAYKSEPGPFGFKPSDLERALVDLLRDPRAE
jgi:hypothetical protein